MAGLSFDELSGLDHQPSGPALDTSLLRIQRASGPITVTVAGDPSIAIGLAFALASARSQTVAVIDTMTAALQTQLETPAADGRVLATQLPKLRAADPIRPSGQYIDVFDCAGIHPADLIELHAIVCRSYPVIVVLGADDTSLGLGSTVIYPARWTRASIGKLATALDAAHRGGEPILNRVVIAVHTDQAEPGFETEARRWLAAFPIHPCPSDPATHTHPISWDAYRPITRTAYTNLAATSVDH